MKVGFGDVPAALKQKLALPAPLLAKTSRYIDKLTALHVIEHDDIRASVDRFVRFRLCAYLDIEQ